MKSIEEEIQSSSHCANIARDSTFEQFQELIQVTMEV